MSKMFKFLQVMVSLLKNFSQGKILYRAAEALFFVITKKRIQKEKKVLDGFISALVLFQ